MARKPKGWRGQSARHSLAARGIKTGSKKRPKRRWSVHLSKDHKEYETRRELPFGKMRWGSVSALFSDGEWSVITQLYQTKQIGLAKEDRAPDGRPAISRMRIFKTKEGAMKHVTRERAEITRRI